MPPGRLGSPHTEGRQQAPQAAAPGPLRVPPEEPVETWYIWPQMLGVPPLFPQVVSGGHAPTIAREMLLARGLCQDDVEYHTVLGLLYPRGSVYRQRVPKKSSSDHVLTVILRPQEGGAQVKVLLVHCTPRTTPKQGALQATNDAFHGSYSVNSY